MGRLLWSNCFYYLLIICIILLICRNKHDTVGDETMVNVTGCVPSVLLNFLAREYLENLLRFNKRLYIYWNKLSGVTME